MKTFKQTLSSLTSANANLNALATIFIMIAWIQPNWTIYIGYWTFFITAIIDIILNRKYHNIQWSKDKWIYISMIAYCAMIPIWQLFSTPDFTHRFFIKEIENHLPFLGIGIIGIFGLNRRIKLLHIGIAMIVAANIIELYIISKAGIHNFIISENKSDLLETMRLLHVNSHMVVNMYFNTALLFAIYLLSRKKIDYKIKIIILIFTIPIVSQLFISDGRTGFATTVIIIGCTLIYNIWKWKHRIIWISLPIIAAATILLLMQHPRINGIFDDPRVYIWNTGMNIFLENPMGLGAIDGHRTYVDTFFSQCRHDWFFTQYPTNADIYKMHPHNVFLESSINYGIIGLIISLSVYILPLIFSTTQRRPFVYGFFLIIFGQSCFDVYNSFPSIACALGTLLWLQGNWTK